MKSETNLTTFLQNIFKKETFVFILAVFLVACNKSDDPKPAYPKDVSVEYRITTTKAIAKVTSVSYTNATGGTTNVSDTPIPFSVKFDRTVNLGDDLGLSVLHNNSASGNSFDLTLEILVNGKVEKTETFEGTHSVIGAIVHLFM